MTLIVVILGAVFQLIFALFSFMAIAFTSGSSLPDGMLGILLDKAMIGIPGASVFVTIVSIYLYSTGGDAAFYWLHAIPVTLLIIFFILRF